MTELIETHSIKSDKSRVSSRFAAQNCHGDRAQTEGQPKIIGRVYFAYEK